MTQLWCGLFGCGRNIDPDGFMWTIDPYFQGFVTDTRAVACMIVRWQRRKPEVLEYDGNHGNTLQDSIKVSKHSNGLVQDCSISGALVMDILQSCIKSSMYTTMQRHQAYKSMEQLKY